MSHWSRTRARRTRVERRNGRKKNAARDGEHQGEHARQIIRGGARVSISHFHSARSSASPRRVLRGHIRVPSGRIRLRVRVLTRVHARRFSRRRFESQNKSSGLRTASSSVPSSLGLVRATIGKSFLALHDWLSIRNALTIYLIKIRYWQECFSLLRRAGQRFLDRT